MPNPTPTHFLSQLQLSQVLSTAALDELRRLDERGVNPEEIRQHAMAKGWLTPWQVQQLKDGQAELVFGDYVLMTELGRGGMGTVYQAHHRERPKELVALKVMNPALLENDELVVRFQREVKAGSLLKHPHVVETFGQFRVDRNLVLLMEYIPGRDLESWLRLTGPLPLGWACECVRQAAIAAQYGHEHQLVHRDIKPDNLLVLANSLTELPLVKLLDLGLARFTGDQNVRLTTTGQIVGTIDYMSHEQAESSKHADIRSDIFSLGCTLFKLLTNHFPFAGKTMAQKLAARRKQDPYPVSQYRRHVPPELEAVLRKSLQRHPDDRYQQPYELAEALAPFCGIEARPVIELCEPLLANELVSNAPSAPDPFLSEFARHSEAQRFRWRKPLGWAAAAIAAAGLVTVPLLWWFVR